MSHDEIAEEGREVINKTINAMRQKREAFDELGRLRQQYKAQNDECIRLRGAEEELINKVIAMGLDAEWMRRVREEL